jgi:hypothetical protein
MRTRKIYSGMSFTSLKRLSLALVATGALLGSCNNMEDATRLERKTFMHFYESANNYVATTAAEVPEANGGGFIIGGTIELELQRKILLIRTDKSGIQQWEKIYDGASLSNLVVLADGGFLLVGQTVTFNPNSPEISELDNYAVTVKKLDDSGNILKEVVYSRELVTETGTAHVDYFGSALAFDDTPEKNILLLGSFKEPGDNEYAYVAALHPETLEISWMQNYDYIVRNYSNAKSLYYGSGKIMWATNVSESEGNFKYSYLAVPVVNWNSSFVNSNYYGQNDDQQSIRLKDLRKSVAQFAAIGTYSEPDGTKGNIFLIRVDPSGNFIPGSERYFDGQVVLGETAGIEDPTQSNTEDLGESITATPDGGFVIAGTMETTPTIGKGGKDVLLIGTDAAGNPTWSKLIGGTPSESVASIGYTSDGGLLICGTIQEGSGSSGGLKSIFLYKTSSKGELKD